METACIVTGYLLICAAVYCLMALLYRKNARLPIPPAPVYYILSFTWGLPVTLAGCAAALLFRISGQSPAKLGYNRFFFMKRMRWGLSLGPFAFVPENCGERLMAHEHGHGIQNAWLGPFMPFVVMIPSAVRFWARYIMSEKKGRKLRKPYDGIWFEGSATINGERALSVPEGNGVSPRDRTRTIT